MYTALAILIASLAALFWIVGRIRVIEDNEENSFNRETPPAGRQSAGNVGESFNLENKVAEIERKVRSFGDEFTQWQKNKDKLSEKLVLSGLKQEIAAQSEQFNAVAASLGELKNSGINAQEEYNRLKTDVAEILQKQYNSIPLQLQPILAKYRQENEALVFAKENFLRKLKEKNDLFDSLLNKFKEAAALKQREFASKNDEFSGLRSQMRENLLKLNSSIDEFTKASLDEKKFLDGEIEALNSRKTELINSNEASKLKERDGIAAVREELSQQIDKIRQDLSETETRNSEILSSKEDEILSLNSQILQIESQIHEQRNSFSRMADKFKRRIAYKQEAANERKKAAEEEQNKIIAEKKQEFERLKKEVINAENALRLELESELASYREEEQGLLKARSEYARKLESERAEFSKRLSEYESEISKFKQKIIESEKRWNEEISLKKENFEREKHLLFESLKAVRENIEQEQLGRQELVESMNREFKAINEASINVIQDLKARFKNSEQEFNKNKEDLLAGISESAKLLEVERCNMDETATARLSELNSLRRRYNELSENVERERGELLSAAAKQREKLNEELADLKKLYQDEARLTENEKKSLMYQLENLKMENSRRQEENRLVLSNAQKEHNKVNSELKSEINRIQSEMAKKKELFERTLKEADSEIKKITYDITVKESELKEAKVRSELNIKKSTRPAARAIQRIKQKIAEYKNKAADELKAKNEEIQTLKVRLALRDEMLGNDLRKKEESMSNITKRLNIYMGQLQELSRAQSNETEKVIQPLALKIQHLKERHKSLSEQVESEKTGRRIFESKIARIESEISALENQPPKDFIEFERLVKLQDNEINLLGREILHKEKSFTVSETPGNLAADMLAREPNSTQKKPV